MGSIGRLTKKSSGIKWEEGGEKGNDHLRKLERRKQRRRTEREHTGENGARGEKKKKQNNQNFLCLRAKSIWGRGDAIPGTKEWGGGAARVTVLMQCCART